MKLIINEASYLENCNQAIFLFQIFKIDKFELNHLEGQHSVSVDKVHLQMSDQEELSTSLYKEKIIKDMNQTYRNFYQEIEKIPKKSCYLLIEKADYDDWFTEGDDLINIVDDIKEDISLKFRNSKLDYLPRDLVDLVGKESDKKNPLKVTNDLKLLVEKKEALDFLSKAPMDISLMMVISAIIMGTQVFLWNHIWLSINTYYYTKQYSSFFWAISVSGVFCAFILIILMIPLFFSLRSGVKDLIKWIKVSITKKYN